MSLKQYQEKRHFDRTPEPKGKARRRAGKLYIIQKHVASRLHYDFRLELDGVLKSWAVPKGPSLDPSQKRLAVHVEDHPIEYGSFEGIIPQGEYGGGTVLLWDRGTWEAVGNAAADYREGKLKFVLDGEKLKGAWMLVRKGGAKTTNADEKTWFLFKERDEYASEAGDEDILEEAPQSVASERSLDEIAAAQDRVWGTHGKNGAASSRKIAPATRTRATAKGATAKRLKKTAAKGTTKKSRASHPTQTRHARVIPKRGRGGSRIRPAPLKFETLRAAPKKALPRTVQPELATLVQDAPAGNEWLHEIKFDGYRMLCRIDEGKAEFYSRNGQSWSDRLAHLGAVAQSLPCRQALLDGEVVALDDQGISNFQTLQNAFRDKRGSALVYYVFDLLHLDGKDLTRLPLSARKQILEQWLATNGEPGGPIRYTEHIVGDGPRFFAEACQMGLEGIVSKRLDRPYVPGRGYDWLKVKCARREEFVIGGYTDPKGSRVGLGALLIGYYNAERHFIYAGKVGTGFSGKTLEDLHERLRPLARKTSPFEQRLSAGGPARTAHWVEPQLVAQVEFSNWTDDGLLRHPSFQGLREDKRAATVTRDRPLPVEAAVAASAQRGAAKQPAREDKTRGDQRNSHHHSPNGVQAMQHESTPKQCGAPAKRESAAAKPTRNTFAGVRLTHPDKVLYADEGITKQDLAEYYVQVADWILPQIAGRPLVLVRCPEGQGKACFYQKHPGAGTPASFRRIRVREKTSTDDYLVAENLDDLIALVQMGALELHVWGSRADNIERADRLIFDLDPDPSVAWPEMVKCAREIRELLKSLGLESFLKTTGGKGLHIVAPIDRRHDWDTVKEFCHAVADKIVADSPNRYTSNMSKAARKGKIFVDYLRNQRGATSVAAYSTRSRPGAHVSVPITWEELTAELHSDHFTIENLPRRLARLKGDPWAEISSVRQSITSAARQMVGLARS